MRVVTLGGIGNARPSLQGLGYAMPYLSPSPQPYFIASESWNAQMPTGAPTGVRGLGVLEDVPMWVKHVAIAGAGLAAGFYLGKRSRR